VTTKGGGSGKVLTARERQVADLVMEGCRDREIAERLHISRRTAEWYLRQIFNKLGVDTRARVAAWAARNLDARLAGQPGPTGHNLPLQINNLIGRAQELDDVASLLEARRLVTLTGFAGVGKTRLALEVASRTLSAFPNGVWFVDLAPLSDPQLLPATVGSVVRINEWPGQSPTDSLIEALQGRRMLLIFDNCEHLIDNCARLVHTVLTSCSGTVVLATSREPLRVAGEAVWHVKPLPVPLMEGLSIDSALASPAVSLFVDRARLVNREFEPSAENIEAISQICCKLDGVPLALELAAARMGAMHPEGLLNRLDDRLEVLTGGSRSGPGRHRTLQAAIDWSADLLDDVEQDLLRQSRVFVGGFTAEASEAVLAGEDLDPVRIVDELDRMVDKSLLTVEIRADQSRYSMLESLREYVAKKGSGSDNLDGLKTRHAEFFLGLAEEAFEKLRSRDTAIWHLRMTAELGNLRAAFEWASSHQPATALRLAYALTPLWVLHGSVGEGHQWITRALECYAHSDSLRARALAEGGWIAAWSGDKEAAAARWSECLVLARELNDPASIGQAETQLGQMAVWRGELSAAGEHYRSGFERLLEVQDKRELAVNVMLSGDWLPPGAISTVRVPFLKTAWCG
jgi:predicted ATPase/DNA-binding CsgD family transcriptional regulator